jgi:hypothetical protein
MEQDKEIQESSIEHFLESHKGKIIEYMESKIGDYDKFDIPKNELGSVLNELMRDVPYGIMIQLSLTHALMHSLWCGQRSQILINDSQTGFKEEYAEQIQNAIIKAYNIGRNSFG